MSKTSVRPTTVVKYALLLEALNLEVQKDQPINLYEFIAAQKVANRVISQLLRLSIIETASTPSGYIMKDTRNPMIIARELAHATAKAAKASNITSAINKETLMEKVTPEVVAFLHEPYQSPIPDSLPEVKTRVLLSLTPMDAKLLGLILEGEQHQDLAAFASRINIRLQQAS